MSKTTKVVITAELEIENRDIYDADTLVEELMNECIKVKSGPYENMVVGYISSATVVKN